VQAPAKTEGRVAPTRLHLFITSSRSEIDAETDPAGRPGWLAMLPMYALLLGLAAPTLADSRLGRLHAWLCHRHPHSRWCQQSSVPPPDDVQACLFKTQAECEENKNVGCCAQPDAPACSSQSECVADMNNRCKGVPEAGCGSAAAIGCTWNCYLPVPPATSTEQEDCEEACCYGNEQCSNWVAVSCQADKCWMGVPPTPSCSQEAGGSWHVGCPQVTETGEDSTLKTRYLYPDIRQISGYLDICDTCI